MMICGKCAICDVYFDAMACAIERLISAGLLSPYLLLCISLCCGCCSALRFVNV